jgi:phosphohistidine phosphatase SixA
MRGFRDWVLQPLLTAAFVIVLGGLIYAFLPWQSSLARLQRHFVRTLQIDYNRNLSDGLLAELRNDGFTFFVRHASRDELSPAIDRAAVLDKTFVPTEYRRGLCLNEQGRVESQIIGYFFRAAKISIGEVVASPVCRARETAELAFGHVDRLDPSLILTNLLAPGEERAAQKKNLKKLLEQTPASGTNRVLAAHDGVLESIGYENVNVEPAGIVIFQHTKQGQAIRAVVDLRSMLYALSAPWLDNSSNPRAGPPE